MRMDLLARSEGTRTRRRAASGARTSPRIKRRNIRGTRTTARKRAQSAAKRRNRNLRVAVQNIAKRRSRSEKTAAVVVQVVKAHN